MSTLDKPSASISNDDVHLSSPTDAESGGRAPRLPPKAASVKINVEGAFIVDDDTPTKNGAGNEYVHWEHKDIRLPHHTAVVSHIAVDVSHSYAHVASSLTLMYSDWWFSGQVGVLLPRVWVRHRRRQAELPQLRDRPDRLMYQFHTRPEAEADQAEWLHTRGFVYHGYRRWSIQVLQQNERCAACGCHTGR